MKNMKAALLILSLIAFNKHLYAQQEITISGSVIEAVSSTPVPYASIGLLNNMLGTVSGNNGIFRLTVDAIKFANDTLRVSSIGYYAKCIAFKDILKEKNKGNLQIQLERKVSNLREVIVAPYTKTKEIGKKKTGGVIQITFNPLKNDIQNNLGSEIGMVFSNKRFSKINDFNFYISANDFDHLKFRINIYTIHNGLPDSNICDRNIIAEINDKKTGWNKIDLSSYNITVQSDFIISLEWISYEATADLEKFKIFLPGSLSLFDTVLFRNASQSSWTKEMASISYFATLTYYSKNF